MFIAAATIKQCKNEDKKCLATVMSEIIKQAATSGNFILIYLISY